MNNGFTLDFTNGNVQGVSYYLDSTWPEYVSDGQLEECLNKMQELVHSLIDHAAYTVEVHTTDGHEHEFPVQHPIAQDGMVSVEGADVQRHTTKDRMPDQIRVSVIKRIYFRM